MVRVCKICGRKFIADHNSRKYCSDWCVRQAKHGNHHDKRDYNNLGGAGYTGLAAAIVITSLQDYARLSKQFYGGSRDLNKPLIRRKMQAIEEWWASPWCAQLCMTELEPWELARMLKAQARRTKAEDDL